MGKMQRVSKANKTRQFMGMDESVNKTTQIVGVDKAVPFLPGATDRVRYLAQHWSGDNCGSIFGYFWKCSSAKGSKSWKIPWLLD